jgi:RecB family exonuclease
MHWLDELLDDRSLGRTLVLCRTSASATAVRRFLASRGGGLGIEVITPEGLAQALEPLSLRPDLAEPETLPTMPQDHRLASVVGRPGLTRLLKEHISAIRVEGLPPSGLPEEVPPLLEGHWGDEAITRALIRLADLAQKGSCLGLGHAYDRVFAIGFGDQTSEVPVPPGPNRFRSRLLSGLGARLLAANPTDHDVRIPATQASDVVAEARWVARETGGHVAAGGVLEDVLVLVAAADDADRVRAALARSGLAVADDGSRPLSQHALATLARRLLPWFDDGPTDAVEIDGEILRSLLQHPFIAQSAASASVSDQATLLQAMRDLPPRSKDADDDEESSDPMIPAEQDLFLSCRRIPEVLRSFHRVRAPLGEWITGLDKVSRDPTLDLGFRWQVLNVRQRLMWLRELRGPTLGHLHSFLLRLGVHFLGDGVAMAIIGALGNAKNRSATEDALDDVLASAASAGEVHRGTVVLRYADYDGRPSGRCLLTGLHSKGIGQAPSPDPLFDAATIATWGCFPGEQQVLFLLAQARAAAARAGEVLACVARRGSDGRAVVSVPGLPLDFNGNDAIDNYGILADELQETGNFKALGRSDQQVPRDPPSSSGDDATTHAARMATLEWIRHGSSFEPAVAGGVGTPPRAPDPLEDSLWGLLGQLADPIPAWIRPWMGDSSGTPDAFLPAEAGLSATGAFLPMTHCLFQAYLKIRLRLKEPEKLVEELDSREIGTAVHEALEALASDPLWRVHVEQRDEAIALMTAKVRDAIDKSFGDLAGTMPDSSPGLVAARAGFRERWKTQLDGWVANRVETFEEVQTSVASAAWQVFAQGEAGLDIERLCGAVAKPLAATVKKKVDPWVVQEVLAVAAGGAPVSEGILEACFVPKNQKLVQGVASQPEFMDLIRSLAVRWNALWASVGALAGTPGKATTEWPFGDRAHKKPFRLDLASAPGVGVWGAVDRVRPLQGDGAQAAELVDFKTGKPPAKHEERLKAGLLPQVVLYALVLREALRRGEGPGGFDGVPAAWSLAYDHVRMPESKKGLLPHLPDLSGPTLDQFERLFGLLIQNMRAGCYPVIPMEMTCPALSLKGHDYCPFQEVCRFRAWPGCEQKEPTDTDESEGG